MIETADTQAGSDVSQNSAAVVDNQPIVTADNNPTPISASTYSDFGRQFINQFTADSNNADSNNNADGNNNSLFPPTDSSPEINSAETPTNEQTDAETQPDAETVAENETGENAEPQPPSRTGNFKALQAENSELNAKIGEFNNQLESFGGLDGFAEIAVAFEAITDASNPDKALAFLNGLPHREELSRNLVSQALGLGSDLSDPNASAVALENRQFLINNVLQNEFGLTSELSTDELTAVFEFIAAKKLSDSDTFLDDLRYDAESLGYTPAQAREQSQVSALQAQIAELEGKLKNPATGDIKDAEQPDNFPNQIKSFQETFNNHENTVFEANAAPLFAEFGLAKTAADTPEIASAKDVLQTALRLAAVSQVRSSEINNTLAEYLWRGESAAENPAFNVANLRYGNALKANMRSTLARVQPFLAALGAANSQPPRNAAPNPNAANFNQGHKGSINAPAPQGTDSLGKYSSYGDLARDMLRGAL